MFRRPRRNFWTPGCEGCHNDGNHRNNTVENLRWDTHAANVADTARHGRRLFGERHPFAKLKDKDARMIKKLLNYGFSGNRLARLYGVSAGTITRVKRGRYRMQGQAAARPAGNVAQRHEAAP